MTAAYVEDTDGARARPARRRAEGHRDDRRDRRPDRGPGRLRATPTRPAATSTSASRASTATASSRTARSTRCSRARATTPPRSRRRRRTSRSGRRARRARTPAGPRPGARGGRAGTSSARRWPRRSSASTSRSTAAARTSSSPTTRTRSPRPRPRADEPLARVWMHNGMVELGTEKMAKSVGNIRLLHGALEQYGREAVLMWLVGGHYRQPLAFSEEALDGRPPRGRATLRESVRRLDPDAARRRGLDALRGALLRRAGRRLQHRPRRARCCSSGSRRPTAASTPASRWGSERCARCSTRSASSRCSRRADRRGAGRAEAPAERARGRARGARLRRARTALRDELAGAGWEVRDTPDGASSSLS